jgi:hypothetical protein
MGIMRKGNAKKQNLEKDIKKFTNPKFWIDANKLLIKSNRLVKMVNNYYEQTRSIRDVSYIMAKEQGLMLNEDQIRSMINKHHRRKCVIKSQNER